MNIGSWVVTDSVALVVVDDIDVGDVVSEIVVSNISSFAFEDKLLIVVASVLDNVPVLVVDVDVLESCACRIISLKV